MWSKAARISPVDALLLLRVPPLPTLFSVPPRDGERFGSVLLDWRCGWPALLLRLSVLLRWPATTEVFGSRIDLETDDRRVKLDEEAEEGVEPAVLGRVIVLDRGRRMEA